MWGVDDAIRAMIKEVKGKLMKYDGDKETLSMDLTRIISEVNEMVFKEENILIPMALGKLTEDEWVKIAEESDEIGFCLTTPEAKWVPERASSPDLGTVSSEEAEQAGDADQLRQGFIKFDTGILSLAQLEGIRITYR